MWINPRFQKVVNMNDYLIGPKNSAFYQIRELRLIYVSIECMKQLLKSFAGDEGS
jgi:hypothetical protein